MGIISFTLEPSQLAPILPSYASKMAATTNAEPQSTISIHINFSKKSFAECKKLLSPLIGNSGCFSSIKTFFISLIAWAWGSAGIKKMAWMFGLSFQNSSIDFKNFPANDVEIYLPFVLPNVKNVEMYARKMSDWDPDGVCPGQINELVKITQAGRAMQNSLFLANGFYNIKDESELCSTIAVVNGIIYDVPRDQSGKVVKEMDGNICRIILKPMNKKNESLYYNLSGKNYNITNSRNKLIDKGSLPIQVAQISANISEIAPEDHPHATSNAPQLPPEPPAMKNTNSFPHSVRTENSPSSVHIENATPPKSTECPAMNRDAFSGCFPGNGTHYAPLKINQNEYEYHARTMNHINPEQPHIKINNQFSEFELNMTLGGTPYIYDKKNRVITVKNGFYNITSKQSGKCSTIAVLNGRIYNVARSNNGNPGSLCITSNYGCITVQLKDSQDKALELNIRPSNGAWLLTDLNTGSSLFKAGYMESNKSQILPAEIREFPNAPQDQPSGAHSHTIYTGPPSDHAQWNYNPNQSPRTQDLSQSSYYTQQDHDPSQSPWNQSSQNFGSNSFPGQYPFNPPQTSSRWEHPTQSQW
ncbi:MAG: hypothetical protein LBI69_02510 [Puniceicoccales bacterium]|jgi:hypothetical protein|nr:hypothetical protein [Puniceicoccales bacterium]